MLRKIQGGFIVALVWLGFVTTASAAKSGDTTVYLHRDGGVVRGGPENGPDFTSAVVGTRGLRSIRVPAYRGSEARWNSLVQCVERQFDSYRVRIVDSRPSSGPYITAMIGGDPQMLGLPPKIGGIAPYNGKLIERAMVFVFDEVARTPSQQCIATAHEIGHALGLDHSTHCSDIMSYGECGSKSFRDVTVACGENGERTCTDGTPHQNTHERLALNVGLRPETREPEAPRVAAASAPSAQRARRAQSAPPVATTSAGRPAVAQRGAPGERPRLRVLRPSSAAEVGRTYRVRLQTLDSDGIARVELVWSDGRTTRRIRCGDRSARDVRCTRRGSSYEFQVRSTAGARHYAVVVTDGRGNVTASPVRSVRFGA